MENGKIFSGDIAKNMEIINDLKKQVEVEIFAWKEYVTILYYFRKIPAFLEIFSSDEIIDINSMGRSIAMLSRNLLAMLNNIISLGGSFLIGAKELKELLEESKKERLRVWFFIEEKKIKIFRIRPTFCQFLSHPYASVKFILDGRAHKKMLQKMAEKVD
jgi:hypothetical protein